ncbi:hypothetical protein F4781DRAFT_207543 [Annulohypoxylon bovei var. microspora]|nr:hypothetical protein F4781DRAFT_207543 [Annulohypoxylon bovei var. microspora]
MGKHSANSSSRSSKTKKPKGTTRDKSVKYRFPLNMQTYLDENHRHEQVAIGEQPDGRNIEEELRRWDQNWEAMNERKN